ncbi:GerW family sporulation protein [Haloferax sp. DFSO52]|uniref:GerW family sporulation protein n=1 Tax=Haloferax sp. DFSO52 TaxID=3388505 RepID=UPI003A8C68B4
MDTDENAAHSSTHEIDVEVAERRLLPPLERILSTDAKTVYGDPVTVGEKTVIPVARLRYGLGMGSGSGPTEASDDVSEGFGGGGGVMASPLGVVEVTPDDTRFVSVGTDRRVAGLFALGLIAGFVLGRLRRR